MSHKWTTKYIHKMLINEQIEKKLLELPVLFMLKTKNVFGTSLMI